MVKRLFSIAAAVALCGGLAMAQGRPAGGSTEGPSITTMRVGPGGGPMQGRHTQFFNMRVRDPMGDGPMMWFHGRGMGSWWKNPEVAQRIGLSDEQIQQLDKISQASRLKTIDLRADLEKAQVILAPMMQVYHPDEAQVLAQVDKVAQARAALEKEGVQTQLASRNVLTEEQWKKLHDTRMGFQRGFGRRGSQHFGMPPIPVPPASK